MLAKFKKKYIGDWDFYQKYLLLAIPMILQNAITNLVSFLDNIMVGQLGTEQMSGVAIVNQLIFVYNLAIFGAVSAASIFGAQYFGKGNHKGHMYSFRFKLYATLLVTGGAILLFLTKGSALISLYLTDTVGNGATDLALQYGLEYLAIMMVGLIPFAVNQSYATNIKETGQKRIKKNRLAPAMLIWGASASLANPQIPARLSWKAQGDNPVCFMRSSWNDSSAVYVGMKMGSPSVNHGHMDVGSFLLEADGVLWGMDMGGEEYNRLETRGVELWNSRQNSQRWDVYRYNNFAHNTLSFNHKYQDVKGKAQIDGYSDQENNMYVISDLTPVYKDQVKSAKRAVSLVNKEYVVVEDVIEATKRFTMMTWTMVTPASAKIVADNVMLLEKDGKKLYIKVEGPKKVRWHISPAQSEFSYDSPNPGILIIGFDTDLELSAKQSIRVFLLPGENKNVTYKSVL